MTFIFSLSGFADTIIIHNPETQNLSFKSCFKGIGNPETYAIVIDGVTMSDCFVSLKPMKHEGARRLTDDIKRAVKNAEASGQNIKITLPRGIPERLVIDYIDKNSDALKKCEADRDMFKNIAQSLSTNGAGKTEAGIDAVADYMSSSAPKSDAKGE